MAWDPPTCVGCLPEKQCNLSHQQSDLALLPDKIPRATQAVSLTQNKSRQCGSYSQVNWDVLCGMPSSRLSPRLLLYVFFI